MKRVLIVLTLVLCLSITGCSKKKEETKPDPTTQTKPEQHTQKEGDYEVTFTTIGREYKVRSPLKKKEGDAVSLDFKKSDIHVMRKTIG